MNHNYLIELGLEDLPANVIDNAIEQFMNKTALFLKQNEINYDHIEQFSTPRRLALLIVGLADKQSNIKFEAK
ncbi:MAG: glycine--tRNA ligase subunit beta, partial [Lactobacillaceae bacterium]